MDSKRIQLLLWTGVTALCLVAISACRRSRDIRPAGPETATPWTLTLAAPIEHLDAPAREPMIVEHPDGTLFVSGYGSGVPALWKSGDGGATWSRVKVGTEADGAIGSSDIDLAVAYDGTLYFVALLFDREKWEGKQVSVGVSKDVGATWKWTLLSKTRFDDRPWIKVAPDGTAHVIWNDGAGVCYAVSRDGGLTWTERARINPTGGSSHLAVGPKGEVAVRVMPVSASGNRYDEGVDFVAVSTDGGLTWRKQTAPGTREWKYPPNYTDSVPRWVEPLAWDERGALYSLWTELKGVWLARSVDRGETWTTWRLAESPEVAYYPYLVARGSGELAATWFSGRPETLQAYVARINVGEEGAPPVMVESQPFRPDSWRKVTRPEDSPIRDTAGEYLAISFLHKGGLVVVSPIQNWREKRFGFSLWKVEERRGEAQRTK